MDFIWNQEVRCLFNDRRSQKVLVANDREGNPHIAVDSTISVDETGNIIYQEFLETSQRNAALVNSLWFKHLVWIHAEQDHTAYEICGIPVRSIISGPVFEQYYQEALKKDKDADLSTVWVIEPQKAFNRSLDYLKEKEKQEHPLIMHLDHLQKQNL